MYNRLISISLLLAILILCSCTPATKKITHPYMLKPFGTAANSPATIKFIPPKSTASNIVSVGDMIIAFDDKPIKSTWEYFTNLNPNIKKVHLKTSVGSEKIISLQDMFQPETYVPNFLIFEPEQTIVFSWENPLYKIEQPTGLVYSNKSIGLVALNLWPTEPRYLELYIELRVNQGVKDCHLKNIAVLDLGRNSYLTPVTPDYVAWALFPDSGNAPRLMPVPPPTPVTTVSTSHTTGNFKANTFGDSIFGSYSALTTTYAYTNYDYTNTYMAQLYNIAATIRQNTLRQHVEGRRNFIMNRISNLRFGKLNPSEWISGYIHFHLPVGFNGPFAVFVDDGKISAVKFLN